MKKIISLVLVFITMFSFINTTNAETIRGLKAKLDKLLKEHKQKTDTIKQTESQMNATKSNITKIYNDMDFISSEIIRIGDEIVTLNEDIKNKDKQLKELIKTYQTTTEGSFYIEYIFGAETIEDFIYRYSITEQISKYNNDLINQMEKKIEDNKKKNIELNNKTVELEKKQSNLKVQLNKLGREKKELQEQELAIEDEIKSAKDVISMYERAGCKLDEDLNKCANRLLPPDTRFYRPMNSAYITSEFGNRVNPLTGRSISFHSGIDMSGVALGSNVLSVANGVVAKIFWTSCGGNQVYVHHNINGKKYTSAYLHLLSINVAEGQFVSKDTVIGKMGGQKGTGDKCTTGAHLHLSIAYGLRWKDYWTYNEYVSRLVNPRQVINFPKSRGVYWYDRITRY